MVNVPAAVTMCVFTPGRRSAVEPVTVPVSFVILPEVHWARSIMIVPVVAPVSMLFVPSVRVTGDPVTLAVPLDAVAIVGVGCGI